MRLSSWGQAKIQIDRDQISSGLSQGRVFQAISRFNSFSLTVQDSWMHSIQGITSLLKQLPEQASLCLQRPLLLRTTRSWAAKQPQQWNTLYQQESLTHTHHLPCWETAVAFMPKEYQALAWKTVHSLVWFLYVLQWQDITIDSSIPVNPAVEWWFSRVFFKLSEVKSTVPHDICNCRGCFDSHPQQSVHMRIQILAQNIGSDQDTFMHQMDKAEHQKKNISRSSQDLLELRHSELYLRLHVHGHFWHPDVMSPLREGCLCLYSVVIEARQGVR